MSSTGNRLLRRGLSDKGILMKLSNTSDEYQSHIGIETGMDQVLSPEQFYTVQLIKIITVQRWKWEMSISVSHTKQEPNF